MPFHVEETDGGLGIVLTISGDVPENEYVDFYLQVLENGISAPKKHIYGLSDFTGVTRFDATSEAIAVVADKFLEFAEYNRDLIAVIVADQDLLFGLSRMWQALTQDANWDSHIFRDRGDAEDWIAEKALLKFGIKDLTFR